MCESFYEALPIYMSMGMSYDEFWHKESYLTQIYLRLHQIKAEEVNEQLWLQGAYIFNALEIALFNSLGRSKCQKAKTYIEKPVELFKEEKSVKEERNKIVDFFNNLKNTWDNNNG